MAQANSACRCSASDSDAPSTCSLLTCSSLKLRQNQGLCLAPSRACLFPTSQHTKFLSTCGGSCRTRLVMKQRESCLGGRFLVDGMRVSVGWCVSPSEANACRDRWPNQGCSCVQRQAGCPTEIKTSAEPLFPVAKGLPCCGQKLQSWKVSNQNEYVSSCCTSSQVELALVCWAGTRFCNGQHLQKPLMARKLPKAPLLWNAHLLCSRTLRCWHCPGLRLSLSGL